MAKIADAGDVIQVSEAARERVAVAVTALIG
jgi:hypothetical protein